MLSCIHGDSRPIRRSVNNLIDVLLSPCSSVFRLEQSMQRSTVIPSRMITKRVLSNSDRDYSLLRSCHRLDRT